MDLKKKEFDAVVISGGGTNGILALGTLDFYHKKKLYDPKHIKEYAGTSVGSIICLLLACGYSPMEIFQEICNMENFFSTRDFQSFWEIFNKMGIMNIQGLIEKVESLVKKKLGCIPTLAKLKDMTGKRLCMSGTNSTQNKGDRYTPETHPNLNCVKAVSISCCLPFVFQRVKYKGDYVLDGGLVNNYPWDFITEGLNILGIVIIVGDNDENYDNEFMGYLYRVITLPINTLTELRCQIAPANVHTVKIAWKGTSMIQFSMTRDMKMDMFLEGYRCAEENEKIEYIRVEGWEFKFYYKDQSPEEWNKAFDLEVQWN